MISFSYVHPETIAEAIGIASTKTKAKYLGGGTNLIDLMRENIEKPRALIDVTGLSKTIETHGDSILIGAGVKNTAVTTNRVIRERYPALVRAILAGASAQIRNMATVGGNILQRTRCSYFYDKAAHCNKRRPESGCDALNGLNRNHAILGASPACVATHPSDMCVALVAFDAVVHLQGPKGQRTVKLVDFHRLPHGRPDVETELKPGELITSI
jgi:xanthine dehydrogenase YagS FAD-binding subunit